MKSKPRDKSPDWVECVDQLDNHRANAEVVAGLLEGCALECMDQELIAGAGSLIRQELKEIWALLRRLEKALGK
jgi:hypothetical protein